MKPEGRAMRSGELAAMAGVSSDTLRYYERKGLLPAAPRSANGYRLYPADTLERVRLIRSALHLGFTVDELAPVLRMRVAGGLPCKHVRDMAAAKLRELRERQKELAQLARELGRVVREWDRRLRNSGGGPARLLETLAETKCGGHLAPPFSSRRGRNSKRGENT